MTTYTDVKAIVETLVAQGVHPSRKRVRAELGDVGSYETIGKLTDRAMVELGLQAEADEAVPPPLTSADYRPRAPDPSVVASHLATLREETATVLTDSHLRAALAALRSLPEPLAAVSQVLTRQHRRSQAGFGVGAITRPPHREHVEILTMQGSEFVRSATTMLSYIDALDHTSTKGVSTNGRYHPEPTPAA